MKLYNLKLNMRFKITINKLKMTLRKKGQSLARTNSLNSFLLV